MESFQLLFEIMMSIFLTLAAGWCLRHLQVLQAPGFDAINTLCFEVLLSVSLFCNIYGGGGLRLPDGWMFVWALAYQILTLSLLLPTVPRISEKNPVRANIIQACFRSNFITFGMVVAGELGSLDELMAVSVLAGVLIPLYSISDVGILEYCRGGKLEPGRMAKQVGDNPFVISRMISLVLVMLKTKLPVCVETALGNTASYVNPMPFLALGGRLNLMSVGGYKKEALTGMGCRLVFQPAMLLRLSYLLGFRGIEFLALVTMLISPTAVATYNIAWNVDVDGEPVEHLVVSQSLGSMAMIFLRILLLGGLGVL